MIRRSNDIFVEKRENVKGEGAAGNLELNHLLESSKNELLEKGRLFARAVIKPGDALGYHVHTGEMESYYILSGKGEYDDNGQKTIVEAGDVTITNDGEGHGIKNVGDIDLEFIALILYN